MLNGFNYNKFNQKKEEALLGGGQEKIAKQHKQGKLTAREQEVLNYIVTGKSNNEIAEALCVSIHTIKAHVCSILQKFHVDDRLQAAVLAVKYNFVDLT